MDKSDLMIMTGASANHFVSSLNCMLSFISALPHSSFLFIDFGLPKQDICYLSNAFRLIHDYHLTWNSTAFIYYRVYNWSVFPHWMHMDATNHGGYTWKPICIRDALYEWKAVVMWNDAGNQFREYALRGLSLVKPRWCIHFQRCITLYRTVPSTFISIPQRTRFSETIRLEFTNGNCCLHAIRLQKRA